MATHYVPWVADFNAEQHRYSAWVTDFGRNPVSAHSHFTSAHPLEPVTAPVSAASGLDWGSVALGGVMGLAVALLAVTMVLVIRARMRPSGARAAA
jgi:hypothetical protein